MTLENYTCKSFIKLSPGVSYIGIVFSGEEKKNMFFLENQVPEEQANEFEILLTP